jgi:hypothetical protein
MNRFLGGAAIFAALVAIWGSGAAQQVAAWMSGQDQPIAQVNNDTTDIPPAEVGDADDETVEQAGRLARRQRDADASTDIIPDSPDAVVDDEEDDDNIGEDLGAEVADTATEEPPTPAPSPPQPAVPALW